MGLYESLVLERQAFPMNKGLEWMLRAKRVDCDIYLLFAHPEPPTHPLTLPLAQEADLCGPHPVS